MIQPTTHGRYPHNGRHTPATYPPTRVQTPSNRAQTPHNRAQMPPNRVQTPFNRAQTPSNHVQTPSYRVQKPFNRAQTPSNRVQTPSNHVQTLSNRVQTPSPLDFLAGRSPKSPKTHRSTPNRPDIKLAARVPVNRRQAQAAHNPKGDIFPWQIDPD